MKKLFLFPLIMLFFLLNICRGQVNKYTYYFDERLAAIKESKAVIIGKGFKEDHLFRVDYYGKKNGNLFMSAHYADSSMGWFQGEFTKFYKDGKIGSQGNYVDDQKNGSWQKWDSLGRKTDSTIYQDEKAIKSVEFNYNKNGKLSYYSYKDSLADTFTSVSYDEKGTTTSEVFFKGQTGILKTYDSSRVKLDSLYTREEREAAFPGGQEAWIRYLQANLNANTPIENGARRGTYQVFVKFIVAKDGKISNVMAETNHGYGMEKEVIRIITKGPDWVPAVQYGRKVNAYRRQPVTFLVESR